MAMEPNKEGKDYFEAAAMEYEKQRLSFIADLRRFNSNRGTPFVKIPEVGGQEVDLYYLYQKVTSLGGWQKVNNEQLWEEFQEEFGLPRACVNSAQVLKHVYFRFLNLYEKVNFLGEVAVVKNSEDDDGPARKKICLPIESIQLNYNYGQHKLSAAIRQQYGLTTELYEQSPYHKLEMSLRSGLPNEVDMALNVCVLLSTEGKHVMKLSDTSHIVPLLMAHVGIFENGCCSLQDLYEYSWTKNSEVDFLRFWYETVSRKEIKSLIRWRGKQYIQKEMAGCEVLNVGRDLGTLDLEGQRVLQLAIFLHNLSFEEVNQKIMTTNSLIFRFLMLSMNSTYDNLRQLAMDTIGNLSCELDLNYFEGLTCPLMLDLLHTALYSEDRFILVRGLEILSKVSQLACNESILAATLTVDSYSRLVALLTIQDIQLIVHTLEALYKLSKVGEPFTTCIAKVHKAIDTLIGLVTIEAQSFGPGSLVGIKVVEYIPQANGEEQDEETMRKPTTVIQSINPDSVNIYQVPTSLLSKAVRKGDGKSSELSAKGQSGKGPPVPPPVKEPVTDIETTTTSWLNATYEAKAKSKVNQVELFSDYLQFCRKFNLNNPMSSAEFFQHVKVIFEKCEVYSINRKNGDTDVFLENLCKRPTQRPFAVTTVPAPAEKVRNPLSVNVSDKQTPNVVDPLAHTPTLRQRLMEPPRMQLQPSPPLHSGASKITSSEEKGKSTNTMQSSSTAQGAPRFAGTPYAKVVKTSKPQQVIVRPELTSLQSKKAVESSLASRLQSPLKICTGQPQVSSSFQRLASPTHVVNSSAVGVSNNQQVSMETSQSFPTSNQALQAETDSRDSTSVKSLLATKLHQGLSDQDNSLNVSTPITTHHSFLPNSSITNSSQSHEQTLTTASSSISSVLIASQVAKSDSSIQQNRPAQTIVTSSSYKRASIFAPTKPSAVILPSLEDTVQVKSNHHVSSTSQNFQNPGSVGQALQQTPCTQAGMQVPQVKPTQQVFQPNVTGNQSSQAVTFSQRSPLSTCTQKSSVTQNTNTAQQPQVQPQQGMGKINTISNIQHVNPIIQQNPTTITATLGQTQTFSSSALQQTVTCTTSLGSFISPASMSTSSIVGNQIVSSHNMIVANRQIGCTPQNSTVVNVVPGASTASGVAISQTISSPAVAALLTSSSQHKVTSGPVITNQNSSNNQIVQGPPVIQGQVPTTIVIQRQPNTIVMQPRQVLVQGNGTTTFGSIQQAGPGGTVSFIVPQQYRQNASLTVQGLNIIQPQANLGVMQSINVQPQAQNILQAPVQQNIIQTAPNILSTANNQATLGTVVTNQLGPRQIVLTRNQTTLPVGMQISSVQTNYSGNASTLCIAQPQQQSNYVIQPSSIVSSNLSVGSVPSVAPSSHPVTVNIPQGQTIQPGVQILHQNSNPVESQCIIRSDQSVNNQLSHITNNQISTLVSTDSQSQQQPPHHTVVGSQTNGGSHMTNGILGSPESVSSDYPPSPVSSNFGSDKEIHNGNLPNCDRDTILKKNDIVQFVDKSAKMNGFIHSQDNIVQHEKQETKTVSNGPSEHGTGHNPASQPSGLTNGCVVNNNLNSLPSPQLRVSAVNVNGNATVQSSNTGSQLTSQPVVSHIHHRQVIGTPQQIQKHQQLQQQQQQKHLQQQQQPKQLTSQSLQKGPTSQLPQNNPQVPKSVVVKAGATGFLQHQQSNTNQQSVQQRVSPVHSSGNGPLNPKQVNGSSSDQKTKPLMVTGQATQTQTNTAQNAKKTLPAKYTPSAPERCVLRARVKQKAPEPQVISKTVPRKPSNQPVLQYMCEWGSCRRCFASARLVFLHVFRTHVPSIPESSCQWAACEKLTRKRWSLVSHVQDHHCSENAMRTACQRRYATQQQLKGNTSVTVPPAPPTPMIYPQDAAMQAIRRFSIKPPYAEFADQREGPVSKHIRLTAALILRNICKCSAYGRRLVQRHEDLLCFNTMNTVEASTALSNCLWEISRCCEEVPLGCFKS